MILHLAIFWGQAEWRASMALPDALFPARLWPNLEHSQQASEHPVSLVRSALSLLLLGSLTRCKLPSPSNLYALVSRNTRRVRRHGLVGKRLQKTEPVRHERRIAQRPTAIRVHRVY